MNLGMGGKWHEQKMSGDQMGASRPTGFGYRSSIFYLRMLPSLIMITERVCDTSYTEPKFNHPNLLLAQTLLAGEDA